MSAFVYFLLGAAVSIPVAILAPFATTAIQKRRSTRSQKQATIRSEALQREYTTVADYHADQLKLLGHIGVTVLWLTVFWIGQAMIDSIFSLLVTSSYAVNSIGSTLYLPFPLNAFGSTLNAVQCLVDIVVLSIIFRAGIRRYRLIMKVVNFDKYADSVRQELTSLGEEFPDSKIAEQIPQTNIAERADKNLTSI